jgi:hypothetical protein
MVEVCGAGACVSEAGDGGGDASDGGQEASGGVTKTIFVSSTAYNGALGGLSGADAKCQSLANAAGLSGMFRAWLSDAATSAAARLTHASAPYVLPDGSVVAHDWAGLTSGGLLHPIDITERKKAPAFGCCVWTYTGTNGAADLGDQCANWASSSVQDVAAVGDPGATDPTWTFNGSVFSQAECNNPQGLYCVEQ